MTLSENPGRPAGQWIDAVLDEHEGPLLRYAARLTGDLERARDIVQDTFLKLLEADRAAIEGHLAEWLFTVCRNRALDVNRKEQRMGATTNGQLEDHAPPQAARPGVTEHVEHHSAVLAAVADLPERQQELLRLKFQNGLSYEQISRITSLTASNVGFILHTALKSLRERLAAQPQTSEESEPGPASARLSR